MVVSIPPCTTLQGIFLLFRSHLLHRNQLLVLVGGC
ncbi:hypothetical protein LINGRAHAP2_LOCUS14079 [Linum grandiflorum]